MNKKKEKSGVELRRELDLEFIVFKKRTAVKPAGRDDFALLSSYSSSYKTLKSYIENQIISLFYDNNQKKNGEIEDVVEYELVLRKAFSTKRGNKAGRVYILAPGEDPNLINIRHPHPLIQAGVMNYERILYLIRIRMGSFGPIVRDIYKRVNYRNVHERLGKSLLSRMQVNEPSKNAA